VPPLLVGLALLCIPSPDAFASESIRIGVGLTSSYTDNLLQYSDEQVRQFTEGTAPTHYSIESIDDGVWRPALSLTWETEGSQGRGREIRLGGSGEFHARNGTADFRSMGLAWRESFRGEGRLALSGSYIPSYYLRQLFDEDVPTGAGSRYRRADFSLLVGSVGWTQPLADRVRGEISYRYEHRGYNDDFLERTSQTHQGEAGVEWLRPRGGRLELHGGYRTSIAKADDMDNIANDDPDIGYHGLVAGVGGRLTILGHRRPRTGLYGSYEVARRSYGSQVAGDVSHNGREDTRQEIEVGVRGEPNARFTARAFYRHEGNRANFPAGGGAALNPGSYDENQVGIALDWSAVLWQSQPTAVEGDDSEGVDGARP